MTDLNKKYLFRMTHIENIPHILQYGITHSSSKNANPDFKPIGDNSLISTRNNFILNNEKHLGEYIPFYLGVRMPMLYVIQHGFNMVLPANTEEIIYCVSSIQKIIDLQLDFIFTDGHAVDRLSSQYTIKDVENIENIIDWDAVNAKYWKDENDLDLKRRKESEFLVLGDIAINAILGYIVFNEDAKNKLIDFGIDESKIGIKSDWYF